MLQEELNLIVENHGKWLRDEEGGSRADLRGADLRGAVGNRREIKTIQTNLW